MKYFVVEMDDDFDIKEISGLDNLIGFGGSGRFFDSNQNYAGVYNICTKSYSCMQKESAKIVRKLLAERLLSGNFKTWDEVRAMFGVDQENKE